MQTEIRRDFQIQTEIHKKIKKREKKQEKIDGKFSKQKHTNIVFLSKSTENNNRANETIIKWEKLDCEKSVKFPRIQWNVENSWITPENDVGKWKKKRSSQFTILEET